ncbi:hypothetical protein ACJX0J_039880, partial [Zea mays]
SAIANFLKFISFASFIDHGLQDHAFVSDKSINMWILGFGLLSSYGMHQTMVQICDVEDRRGHIEVLNHFSYIDNCQIQKKMKFRGFEKLTPNAIVRLEIFILDVRSQSFLLILLQALRNVMKYLFDGMNYFSLFISYRILLIVKPNAQLKIDDLKDEVNHVRGLNEKRFALCYLRLYLHVTRQGAKRVMNMGSHNPLHYTLIMFI